MGNWGCKSSLSKYGMNPSILVLASILAFFGSAAGLRAQAITLRIATNVPTGSAWDNCLHRLATDFLRVSGGRVGLAFPQSARGSTESDIIQKMRLGIDGALLTTYGLAELYPDILALSIPGIIRNDSELEVVLEALEPLIRLKLSNRYAVLAVSNGGWIRYFSRSPIIYPSDLARMRFSMLSSDEKISLLMQNAGAKTITGTTAQFILQLNANSIDAVFQSPIYIAALWSQLRGKISYMTSFKVAPFIGAIIFNKASWDKVPVELRDPLQKVVQNTARRMSVDTIRLEADAITALDGIKVPVEPTDAQAQWAKLSLEWRKGLGAQMFSAEFLDAIDSALFKVRDKKKSS